MLYSWTSDVKMRLHDAKLAGHQISQQHLAASLGWTPEYLSMVLNGKRTPPGAEEKVLAALEQLISERST